jgi:hypothetical protein
MVVDEDGKGFPLKGFSGKCPDEARGVGFCFWLIAG